MNAVLHIGTEKTGSKTVQRFLNANRRHLSNRGIGLITSCGVENNRDLATFALADSNFHDDHLVSMGISDIAGKRSFQEGVRSRFIAEVSALRTSCDTVIITSEHLQSRLKTPAELLTLKGLLADASVAVKAVVVYLREPSATLWSLYSTALRNGSRMGPPHEPPNRHWIHICDHRRTIELWASVFGSSRIVPRLFEESEFLNGSLVDDFAAATGIGSTAGLVLPPSRNRGLTSAGQTAYRLVNLSLPRGGRLRRSAARWIDAHLTGVSPPVPPDLAASCDRRFRESNEWVRERYYPHRQQLFTSPEARTPAAEASA